MRRSLECTGEKRDCTLMAEAAGVGSGARESLGETRSHTEPRSAVKSSVLADSPPRVEI